MSFIERQKILIFVSKTGGGHISLAEALRDRLEDRYTVDLLDPQPGLVHTHYRLVSRHALWLWATEFRLSNGRRRARSAHQVYVPMLSRRLEKALRTYRPDLVMSTYPFLTIEVTHAMRRIGTRVPFAMLFADPNGVHQTWLTEKSADAVFAPTHETYRQAIQTGFPPEYLHLTGWPVRAQFYRNWEEQRAATLQKLGLEANRFTVFLQGGGEGAAGFVRTVQNLLSIANVQIILAAGTNRALLEQFAHTPRLAALPFTQEIAPYMAAADVVMGKAGPNMLFESMTLGKPFIATAYIPGQEHANLAFIQRHHLGWVALDIPTQRALIDTISRYPTRLAEMQASVETYRKWNIAANETIGGLVDQLIERKPIWQRR